MNKRGIIAALIRQLFNLDEEPSRDRSSAKFHILLPKTCTSRDEGMES